MLFSSFTIEIDALRRVHAGARVRARSVWALAVDLSLAKVWLPCGRTLEESASAIYYNASYDAMERYESLADFKEAVSEDLAAAWPVRSVRNGVECFVVRPFLGKSDDGANFLHHLGFGGFHGIELAEVSGLRVEPLAARSGTPTGLSDDEMAALLAFHRGSTLTLINLLRKLRTGLCYIDSAINDPKHKNLDVEEGARDLVAKLVALTTLPGLPPAARFFGTDANRTNVVRTLDMELARTLTVAFEE